MLQNNNNNINLVKIDMQKNELKLDIDPFCDIDL